ncbi:MAG TPA: DUF1553 domain-containing protein, partial [Isosphaeraceae bacterium]
TLVATLALLARSMDGEPSFRDRVAPILERHCVSCHNDADPKGKLSLATEAGLRRGGEGGPAVEPGNAGESAIVEKIAGTKPEMPRNAPQLAKEEVETIRRWVASGAHWPEGLTLEDRKLDGGPWWSLRSLHKPSVPATKTAGWARTPIDAFILAALEAKGLTPSPEANRRTLIRRVSFDLLGLPPSPEEVEAFVNDRAADAYERLVDRLLASPAYGERWARHWLDLAHYGDTHGYDKDKRRDDAWPYRDYVIDSFNRDTPYARFILEQLAGDVILPDDPRGIIATGFIAAGPWDFVGHVELREGTVEKEKTRLLDRDDMVATAMGTFASLTIHCARCHDHKFDPIPQQDYYRLQAVFAGVERGDRPFEDWKTKVKRTELARREADVQIRRAELTRSIADPKLRSRLVRLGGAGPQSNGYHSRIEATPDTMKWVQVDLGRSVAIDTICLIPARPVDFPDTPGFGFPARYRVEIGDERDCSHPLIVSDQTSTDVANPGDSAVEVPAGRATGRYVRVTATKLWPRTNDYVFALAELQVIADGVNAADGANVTSLDSIEAGLWSRANLVDGLDSRKPLRAGPSPTIPASLRIRLEEALGRTEAERLVEGLTRATRDQAALDSERASLPRPKQVYAAVPRPPRPIRVLKRGEVEQPEQEVGPGALSCVPGLNSVFENSSDEGARRVALAQWLVDPKNPLTWRSIVNRVWQYHFGRGIVDTPSDFGRNGSLPTHPALLDWLAVEFRDSGGSLKTLHKRIVTSAAYRQSSADRRDGLAIDADNRLLWRMNRRRLDAEEVRDAALAVAGTLDRSRGGPGFEPFRFKDDHSPIYDHEELARLLSPDGRRRSIYRFTVRSVPQPFLECMDAADPNLSVPVRSSTITALQALALWNDPFMLAQANAFAGRVGGRADAAVRLAFGRPANDDERAALEELAKTRGMPTVCRLLFNANEFLYVD